jgi:hypothetical protein
MLVVDGNNGQAFFVSNVTGEWLEVSDDKVDLARSELARPRSW